MNISYSWLKEYINTSSTPQELANQLEIATCEVESVSNIQESFSGLVVGKVGKVINHPGADRLRIATVTVGKKTHTIVCGAPNLEEGQAVVVALPGTTIHPVKGDPFTITEAVIRGEKSEGMLCAAEEIGLPIKSDGILILDSTIKSGTSMTEALNLDDTILELEITPNRPDLLSYQGVAREIGALEKRSLSQLPIYSLEEDAAHKNNSLQVAINDSKLSHRYSAVILENIAITESPLWLQIRLATSGVQPINSIVDVTNYVMLESGQPLHAFDLDTISSGSKNIVHVRSAKANEQLLLLDGTTRKLEVGDIVITDTIDAPIALAGIMGGKESEVTSTTTRVLIESAHFDGPSIRRTSRRLGLRSEASTRFEKGLDPEMTVTALKRVLYLLQEISEGKLSASLIDSYPKNRIERPRIHVSFAKIHQLLGVHISASEAKTILQHLGFQIPSLTKSAFEAVPPSWRQDVKIPEDVIEELIRIWGFDRLPATLPSGLIKAPQPNTIFKDKTKVRQTLSAAGLHETIHLSFTSLSALQKLQINPKECIKLQYPLSKETEYLVPNHALHFLENIVSQNIHQTELGLFEIGHTFNSPDKESNRLSLLLRSEKPTEHLYREAKTILVHLLKVLGRENGQTVFTPQESDDLFLEQGSVLDIKQNGKNIGSLGLISRQTVQNFKIKSGKTILFVSLNLDTLLQLPITHISYREPRTFPSIERDITLIVPKSTPFSEVDAVLKDVKSPLLLSHQVMDIYAGKPLRNDQKSITIHFIYNHPDRTLEDPEVAADQNAIIDLLKTRLQAIIN